MTLKPARRTPCPKIKSQTTKIKTEERKDFLPGISHALSILATSHLRVWARPSLEAKAAEVVVAVDLLEVAAAW
jgi:hypothetical protein